MRSSGKADATSCTLSRVTPRSKIDSRYLAQWLAAARTGAGDDVSATGWRDSEIHARY